MQTEHHRLRTLVISLSIILLLLSTGYIVLIKAIDLDTYKEQILAELQKTINRPVTYKSGNLTFSLGPAISFHGITVKEPDNSADFVTIDHLTFRLDLLPLFRKQLVVHGLVADKPVIRLLRHKDGTFNITDLLESGGSKDAPLKIHQLKLKNADITFTDSFLQQKVLITKLTATDLFMENLARGSKGSFKLSTRLGGGASGIVSITGKIKLSPKESPLDNTSIDAKLSVKQLEAGHLWPYYRQHVPFKKFLGSFDAESEFHGRLNEFTSSGKLSLRSLLLDYQPVFKQALGSKTIQMKYNLELNKADLVIKTVELDVDGAALKGSCAIKEYRSKDPRITAQVTASRLDFSKHKRYIPYGIIAKDTANWIEQHLAGGIYQLDEGKLDGRVSQILHMETGENYNVLYIKARVEKGVVSYGSSVPTFNNVKGTLEMKGKDFFLHGMSGNFGTSPLTLEGKITDYPLDKPSGYPFKMAISPAKSEIAWLLGKKRASHLTYNGTSALTLVGEGFTSGYNLSGDWNLTPAACGYANFIAKPIGTPSQLRFKGSISPKEAILTSLSYTLAGLNLDLSAKYPFEPSKPLDLLINTNQVVIENIAKMSPFLIQYQPSGKVQLALRGTFAPSAEKFKWRGTVALNNASVRYSPSEKPVSEVTGAISFSDDSVESSQLTAKIGTTLLTGKGAISSIDPLIFSTSFTSPRIELADFGFKSTPHNPLITKIKGDISFKDNSLTIRSLSGNLNKSQLTVKGGVNDIQQLKADLAITSAYLDISDLILLAELEKIGIKPSRPVPNPALKATIKADKGVVKGLGFGHLNTTVNLVNKSVQIELFEADLLGGRLTAKGKIESQPVPTRFQTEFKLANASADQVTELLSGDPHKKEITGVMTLEGNISASGDTSGAISKSAAGSIKVHSSKGMLRQFSGLSKVFSILNVSQLFKFKLPDMVSDGMPYTEIKGVLTVKDGTVSTDDFFLTSNAMNMSLVGKLDFVNDNVDLTLGIQPLQTVDKVVSHIPIVGWILTGKEKTMFTTYFEVKGKSTAPKVSAIPITSLGKGVLGIFKRVFMLPAKLVTDTGEVVLGN